MLILASASPRRKELIKLITTNFKVVPPDVDESIIHVPPHNLPAELSKLKAYDVWSKYPDDDILSCDTIVVLDQKIYGKPKDKEDAKRMLRELSGKRHIVISGYTFLGKFREITRTVKTEVFFNELSEETIDKYVENGSPLDKAGAYGIQDKEYKLVNKIRGSYYNVIGLPVEDIKRHVFSEK